MQMILRNMPSTLKNKAMEWPKAGMRALNKMTSTMRTVASATIRQDYNIKKKDLEEYIDRAKVILAKYDKRIVLPVDLAYSMSGERKEIKVSQLPVDQLLADIGSESAAHYAQLIRGAKTIFFNGPTGVFEKPATEGGTKAVLSAIAGSDAYSVLGGGDSIAAVNKFKLADGISYISTGGGALVRFLSGEELPIITALKKAAGRFPCSQSTPPRAGPAAKAG